MKKLSLLSILFVFLWSCNKDDDPTGSKDYFPLAVGNYWVYDHYSIDEDGVETKFPANDSLSITRDTVIRNQTYFVLEGIDFSTNEWKIVEIRDSSNYLVDSNGKVLFARNDFENILSTSSIENKGEIICTTTYKMEKVSENISVPAGSFEVLNFKGTVTVTNPSEFGVDYPRYLNNYFAKNVGKILQTYIFISSPGHMERRLVRFHIED
jgi:hypothetical protein